MIEICHQIERCEQPKPYRNPHGDCFACALAAALPFLYPDVERVDWFDYAFEKFRTQRRSGTDELGINSCWDGIKKALHGVASDLGRLEIEYELIEPHFPRAQGHDHGFNGFLYQVPEGRYARILEGYLRGGWIAFTTVRHAGGGPTTAKDGRVWHQGTDHFVVLDGVRHVYEEEHDEEGEFLSGSWHSYLHVVDSSTSNFSGWHRTLAFLMDRGRAVTRSPHQRMMRAQSRKRGWMYWHGAIASLRRRKVRTPRIYSRRDASS